VREVMSHLETMHVTNDVPLHVEAPAELPIVRADREQLTQVLVNLVQNAADAARARHGGGEHTAARVEVVLGATKEGGVDLRIRDNGPGIPAGEERQRVFEPYYTTKAGGTGLGLAIVHRILSEHLATIEIGDSPPLLPDDATGNTRGGAEVHVVLTKEGPPLDAEASLSEGAIRTRE
jgi:signal transduction histidine kinase